jgi:hypothetical protein
MNGESFRVGGQFSRGRGGQDSHDRQKVATESHIRFFKNIEEKFNTKVEVLINTYKLNDEWDQEFVKWYEPYCVNYSFLDEMMPTEQHYIEYKVPYVKEYLDTCNKEYEFIMFIRIDYYLKKYLLQAYVPYEDKIQFAFLDMNVLELDKNKDAAHLVCFCIVHIPLKFYPILFSSSSFLYHHHMAMRWLLEHKVVKKENIGFIINTFHYLCSSIGWNPIYTNAGRPESRVKKTNNKQLVGDQLIESSIDFNQADFDDTFEETLYYYRLGKETGI